MCKFTVKTQWSVSRTFTNCTRWKIIFCNKNLFKPEQKNFPNSFSSRSTKQITFLESRLKLDKKKIQRISKIFLAFCWCFFLPLSKDCRKSSGKINFRQEFFFRTFQIMIERESLRKYKWKSRKSKTKRKLCRKKFDFKHSFN